MARLIWTEPALQELDTIADYISLDNPVAARKLVQEVFQRLKKLKDHPKSGKLVEEFEQTIYRELVVPPCRLFYREENEVIYIVHVIREEQYLHLELLKAR